ncbi:MAG: NupC/NupG family nucleoside CNT transporter, partial [Planctomycetota bacterium]|nr:NupC/NupG family nucleoside CNT transporter [Planctomycetota bacterium]
MERLIPVLGLCVMVGIAWSLSSDRRRFPVRVVVGGLLMQFLLAVLVLRSEIGQS